VQQMCSKVAASPRPWVKPLWQRSSGRLRIGVRGARSKRSQAGDLLLHGLLHGPLPASGNS